MLKTLKAISDQIGASTKVSKTKFIKTLVYMPGNDNSEAHWW